LTVRHLENLSIAIGTPGRGHKSPCSLGVKALTTQISTLEASQRKPATCQAWYTPVIPTPWEAEVGGLRSRPSKSSPRPYLKNKLKIKKTRSVPQEEEYLLGKYKSLNSIPSTEKKNPPQEACMRNHHYHDTQLFKR
jgi:hypothetical protein